MKEGDFIMISLKKLTIIATLASTLLLSACATQANKTAEEETKKATNDTKITIEKGTQNMRDVLKEMKIELADKKEDQAVKTSEQLEGNWKLFEDDVKDSYKHTYKKVEESLDTISAAGKVKPLDTKVLTESIDNLDKALGEFQQLKENPSALIQKGTQNMRDVVKDMKAKLSANKQDEAVKTSEGLEGNWKIFEDGVKIKSKDIYEKVEDPLHVINAGVKVKPLDTKTIIESLDKLDKALEELQQLK